MLIRHDLSDRPTGGPRAPIKRKDGTTVFEGVIARTHGPGDGLDYAPVTHNGVTYPGRVEYRDVEGLRELVRQTAGRPVVVMHPPKTSKRRGRVGPDTKIVGRIMTVRIEGNEAIAKFHITEPEGIAAIEEGLQELSLGYGVNHLDERGYQRVFDVDHLALVKYARCGSQCSIRTDCADMQNACNTCAHADRVPQTQPQGNLTMAKPTDQTEALRSLESQRQDAANTAAAATAEAASEKLRADTAEGRISVLENEIAELKRQIAAGATAVESEAIKSEKLRADAAEEKVRQFDSTYEGRVRQRVALERKAWIVMGDGFRMDDLSDREIQATVVKHLDANADVTAGVPDGIITGRFLALTERHDSTARSLARVAELQQHTDRHDAAEEAKSKKRDAWKEPLPNSRHARKA